MFDTNSSTLFVLIVIGLLVAAAAVTALVAWAVAAGFALSARGRRRDQPQPSAAYSNFLFDLAPAKDREYDDAA